MAIGMLPALGCNSDSDDEDYLPSKQQPKAITEKTPQKYDYSIYLENSGSLNGYLNVAGDGNFKDNIYSLITEISGFNEKQSLNLYDVNTKVIPVTLDANAAQVSSYIKHLDEKTFRERSKSNGGDQSKSDLSNIIKQLIDSTHKNEVSILISDCIFSPGKNQNALDFLSAQKNNIQGYIREKLKAQTLSTLVLQFTSDFNGFYYDQNNNPKKDHFKQRPYYLVCFGKEEALHHLLDYIKDSNRFKGFRNFLFLTNTKSYEVTPRIRSSTEYYEYDLDKPLTITGIRKGERDNKFKITFEADFSKLPVSEAYIKDRNNYILSNPYTIDSISASDKKGFTHQVTIASDKTQTGKLQIALKKQLPEWIGTSNLDSDSGLSVDSLAGKTFGIRYMLEGIFLAYDSYANTPNYFTFSISVKK
jgi:hypothetical protein